MTKNLVGRMNYYRIEQLSTGFLLTVSEAETTNIYFDTLKEAEARLLKHLQGKK